MIEFVVKDRRMRYYPDDDVITYRKMIKGVVKQNMMTGEY
jgi:hypothetical protein